MATRYVWSGAGGANDGTSWANAYTAFGSAWTAWAAGDVIWVASDHSQTQASDLTFAANAGSNTDPTTIYSVNRSDDSYLAGASAQIAVTGAGSDIIFNDAAYIFGIYFQIADGVFTLINSANHQLTDCKLIWTALSTDRAPTLQGSEFRNCTFNGGAHATFGVRYICDQSTFYNCTFTGRVQTTGLLSNVITNITSYARGTRFLGCDFSTLSGTQMMQSSSLLTNTHFIACRFQSGYNLALAASTSQIGGVAAYGCGVDGSSTAKNYGLEIATLAGGVTVDTAVYRANGWTDEDGDTPLTHKMAPISTLRGAHTPLWGAELRGSIDADHIGSTIFTVYAVHDFSSGPTVNEAWMDVYYLGTTNSYAWTRVTTRVKLASTALTSDTSTWTGASGKTKVKFATTVTVQEAGDWMVRVFLGKYESGKALWYCPLVSVT